MPKRTSNYREQFLKDLLDPVEAACYLSAAIEDSEEDAFILALRDVAEAHQLSRVANEAGMARESIYRTLSASGNPRYSTLRSIVKVLGLRFSLQPNIGNTDTGGTDDKSNVASIHSDSTTAVRNDNVIVLARDTFNYTSLFDDREYMGLPPLSGKPVASTIIANNTPEYILVAEGALR